LHSLSLAIDIIDKLVQTEATGAAFDYVVGRSPRG